MPAPNPIPASPHATQPIWGKKDFLDFLITMIHSIRWMGNCGEQGWGDYENLFSFALSAEDHIKAHSL